MKNTKILLFILPLVFCLCGISNAASNATTALTFLEMGAGARYIGMGGAGTAIADDSTAMYWNPGIMAKTDVVSIDLMHTVYVEDTFYDFAAAIFPAGDFSTIGFSAQYFSAGDISIFDDMGYGNGKINPYDLAVAIGYAANIKGFGIGLTAKYIQSEIINTAQTYAFDFGISLPDLFDDKLKLGVSASNIGEGIKYDAETEDLPMTVRLGVGLHLSDNLLLAADVGKVMERDVYVAGGGEYFLEMTQSMGLYFRAGYNTVSNAEELSGVSAGFGIELKSLVLDYAFVPMGNLGDTHRISLTLFW